MDEEATLRKLYVDDQLSIRAIAERLGMSSNTVRRRLMRYGIARRPKNPEPDYWQTKGWLHQKYVVEKLSTPKIADLVGANVRTVIYTLGKFDIPRRERGGELKGKKMSEASRKKMSLAKRGKYTGAPWTRKRELKTNELVEK